MKIFISWSGPQAEQIAKRLREWLEVVLAGKVTCFVSSEDIARGDRGLNVIARELESRDFGIVILTKANVASPWIHFEAGALGQSLTNGKVAPLLLDITRADVVGPIAQFQSTLLTDQEDFRRFIQDLAANFNDLPHEAVDYLFDAKWPELQAAVVEASGRAKPETSRSPESILEELLELVRDLDRRRPPSELDRAAEAFRADQVERSQRAYRTHRNELNRLAIAEIKRALGRESGELTVESSADVTGDQLVITSSLQPESVDMRSLQQTADDYRLRIVLESLGREISPSPLE
ncbi:toll/interleukin-1 receptor domain-containing protein [Microbacterium maritypicum]|uniref:toll/interleukin-1 receptor domain-containing protein n=1 Tax=Microbacterium maritypicum TaxID=33918 RepID=UPI0038301A46